MRFFHVVLALAALGATHARADDRARIRTQLIAAFNQGDVRTVESLVTFPLRAERVRFSSSACRRFWGMSVLVRAGDLRAFVDCLASENVRAWTSNGDSSVDALFGPGLALGIGFNTEDKVIALTSSSPPGSKPLRIERAMFAARIDNFSRAIAPSKETKEKLDARGVTSLEAELSLCVDPDGATVPVATVSGSEWKSYEQDVAEVARGWKIEPFQVAGKPVLACATYLVGYPIAPFAQPIQVSSDPASVRTRPLQPRWIRGSTSIRPDEATRTKVAATASHKTSGTFRLCLDERGHAREVTLLESTGYDAYDRTLQSEIAKWVYEPYVVSGTATPICVDVVYLYIMR